MSKPTYKIVRFYFRAKEQEVIKTGLTLDEAKAHCSDPASKSTNCPIEEAWFDGYFDESRST